MHRQWHGYQLHQLTRPRRWSYMWKVTPSGDRKDRWLIFPCALRSTTPEDSTSALARCFRDHRDPTRIEHSVAKLVRQRVYGLALGYEDLNDHDQLRADPLLAVLSGKTDVEGQQRRRQRDRGKAGAGKSTLNRLELTLADADEKSRYKKIALDTKFSGSRGHRSGS